MIPVCKRVCYIFRTEALPTILPLNMIGILLRKNFLHLLLVLNMWRRSPSFLRFSKAVNLGLILAGCGLFVFQLNGYVTERRDGPKIVVTKEWGDVKTIVIPSQGSLEYKVAVEEGGVFEYEWMTPGTELFFDFHGEEFDAAPDEFTSFKVATDSRSSGFLTTPFTGRAGWYWRNEGDEATVITL